MKIQPNSTTLPSRLAAQVGPRVDFFADPREHWTTECYLPCAYWNNILKQAPHPYVSHLPITEII